jgi:anthranilate synthase/aminodeoxychorismate synthase-like glutamine amidotransferase
MLSSSSVVIVDNYDSFTFNLFHEIAALRRSTDQIEVIRCDDSKLEGTLLDPPSHLVISPGPHTPSKAGRSCELIRRLQDRCAILGVCLGHQAIAQVFGSKIVRAEEPLHGKTSTITHNGQGVFKNLPSPMQVARYHSLGVDLDSVPSSLEITAQCDSGMVMGLKHRSKAIHGVQFHPESFLSSNGKDLLQNFLQERCQ